MAPSISAPSLIAAAAPTPGGLGALEAALVAGFTGVGMESGVAVAAVLSYRLVTYWLPILPGWISFHVSSGTASSDAFPPREALATEAESPA